VTQPLIYCSCASHELPRARAAMAALRALGVAIVGDWTPSVELHGSAATSLDWRTRASISDGWRDYISRAHVVLALLPLTGKSEGVAYELAVAHCLRRIVVTSHPAPRETMPLVGMSLDALTVGHWIQHVEDGAAIAHAARVAHAEVHGIKGDAVKKGDAVWVLHGDEWRRCTAPGHAWPQ
jgi:hypothetical protein